MLPTSRGATHAPENLSSLVERADLHQLVSKYSGPGRASGSTVTYSCPNPAHPDAHPSFTVTTNRAGRQIARCFSQCDWRGDALDLVKWLEGCDTGEAARKLRAFLGEPDTYAATVRKRDYSPKPRRLEPCETAPSVKPEPGRAQAFLERYLEWRVWPASVVDHFGLEVVLDRFGECRVRHPYLAPSPSGEWIAAYWQDRGTRGPKWLSPRGASPVLYNLRSLEADDLEGVVICEGPADTITAHLALEGLKNVAVIGVPGVSAWRPEWASLLSGLRVVVVADSDTAGRTLEEAVRRDIAAPVTFVRPRGGAQASGVDLSEAYLEHGLTAIRSTLTRALKLETSQAGSVEMLLEYFPEAFEVVSHD